MNSPQFMSGGRYPVLRAVAILYLIGAGLVIIGGVIVAAWMLFGGVPYNAWGRVVLALTTLAATFFACIGLLAIAEGLKLAIDIERNTRMTALAGSLRETRPVDMGATPGGEAVAGRLSALDEETAEAALLRGH